MQADVYGRGDKSLGSSTTNILSEHFVTPEAHVGNRLELAVVLLATVSALLAHEAHVGVGSHLRKVACGVRSKRDANISRRWVSAS